MDVSSVRPERNAPPLTLRGLGVSSGVAIGPALLFRSRQLTAPPDAVAPDAPTEEADVAVRQVETALASAGVELRALAERVAREVGEDEAGIFEAQALMLEDPTITERVSSLVRVEHQAAYQALFQAMEEQAAALAALPDPLWQARAADVRDAIGRALRQLAPEIYAEDLPALLARAGQPMIVVAEDLTPSDTARLRRDSVLGICMVSGGPTAHAAILARALSIPAVAGVGEMLLSTIADGDIVGVDGTEGVVHVRPEVPLAADLDARAAQWREQWQATHAERQSEAAGAGRTRDGNEVMMLANVGGVAEAQQAAAMGAQGIGLLRTEFLFAGRSTLPDEHEQAEMYIEIIRALDSPGVPIVVRTLDAGNDKPLPALAAYTRELPAEANPTLGVRGFRLHAIYLALLDTQLRGLVRAAATTGADIQVMLPMVTRVDEVRLARAHLRAAESALAAEGIRATRPLPLGVMIETPAAVLLADALAREADFFSIGTNDLAQYVMAGDRLNPQLAELTDARQPAVLRSIAQAAAAGRAAGRGVAVCGEMAGDPAQAPLLVGLGVSELSMAPASIPAVRRALSEQSSGALRALALRALEATTLADVVDLLAGM